MKMTVQALGRSAFVGDGASPLRVTLTSSGPIDAKYLTSLSAMLTGREEGMVGE